MLEPPKGKKPDDWEPRPQMLFRATQFGDEVDRPLKKSDGSWTYFAADIAYHHDKFRRGFTRLIDVWGADHGGYVKRMQAAVKALSEGKAELDVKLCQLVNLFDKGEPVRMSKRAGTFVTLREVVDEVGAGRRPLHHADPQERPARSISTSPRSPSSRRTTRSSTCSTRMRAPRSVMRQAEAAFPGIDLSDAALAEAPLDRLDRSGRAGADQAAGRLAAPRRKRRRGA